MNDVRRHLVQSLPVVLCALLVAQVARAVMPPPGVYGQARETAMHHVQVKVARAMGPAQAPDEFRVTAEAVQIFRVTPGTLGQRGSGDAENQTRRRLVRGDDQELPGGSL